MNNMRIKSHKPPYTKTKLPKAGRFTRYTPLGAIRLLPPLPELEHSESTAPAVKADDKNTAKTPGKNNKKR